MTDDKYSADRKLPDNLPLAAAQEWHEAHARANRERMRANEDYERDLYERARAHKEHLARIDEELRRETNRILTLAQRGAGIDLA